MPNDASDESWEAKTDISFSSSFDSIFGADSSEESPRLPPPNMMPIEATEVPLPETPEMPAVVLGDVSVGEGEGQGDNGAGFLSPAPDDLALPGEISAATPGTHDASTALVEGIEFLRDELEHTQQLLSDALARVELTKNECDARVAELSASHREKMESIQDMLNKTLARVERTEMESDSKLARLSESHQAQLASARKEAKDATKERDEHARRVEEKEKELKVLVASSRDALNSKDVEIDALRQDVDRGQRALRKASDSARTTEERLRTEASKAAEGLIANTTELDVVWKRVQRIQGQLDETTASANSNDKRLRARIAQLSGTVLQKDEMIAQLEGQLDGVKSTLQATEKRFKANELAYQNAHAALSNKLTTKESKVKTLQQSLADSQKKVTQSEGTIASWEHTYHNRVAELTTTVKRKDEIVASLESQVSHFREASDEARADLRRTASVLMCVTDENGVLRKEIKEVTNSRNSSVADYKRLLKQEQKTYDKAVEAANKNEALLKELDRMQRKYGSH